MKKRIKITKILTPLLKDGGLIESPKIKNMQLITESIVNISGKRYEQFEYIPNDLNLCDEGNAIRKGSFIVLK